MLEIGAFSVFYYKNFGVKMRSIKFEVIMMMMIIIIIIIIMIFVTICPFTLAKSGYEFIRLVPDATLICKLLVTLWTTWLSLSSVKLWIFYP